jgi:YegS/Rv2252/BmrU family lipid kinase
MRRAALIHNPFSGPNSTKRSAVLRDALAVIRAAGVEAEMLEADAPGSAAAHAREALRRGFDTVLACGGDGTVHEILQCLVGTSIALGVLPLGTANALAQNLGLGSSPIKAARAMLTAVPTEIPIGRISYTDPAGTRQSSYFIVAAGVGLDALLMSRPDPKLKRRFGYAMYVFEVLRIWATHSFPLFCAEFTSAGSDTPQVEQVSQVLAVRIRSFGGMLGELAPGASLHNGRLRLLAFKTRSRLRYFRFLMAVPAGRQTFTGAIELVKSSSVECSLLNGSSETVYVEADGEVLGTLPAKIDVAPQPMTLTLLIPPSARP